MADGSLSQFKATLARKKARKEKTQGKFDRKSLGFSDDKKPDFDFPNLSESEMQLLKQQIQDKAKSDKRKEGLILGIIAVAVICFLIYINQ